MADALESKGKWNFPPLIKNWERFSIRFHIHSYTVHVHYDILGVAVRDSKAFNFLWIENFPLFLSKEDGDGLYRC